jgi:hypothetical protein
MSMTDALAGWIFISTATFWAGKGIRALIADRHRKPATRRNRAREAQKWQWLALAAVQLAIGVWDISGPSTHPTAQWWLVAAVGILFIWLFITDVSPWLRSRMQRQR